MASEPVDRSAFNGLNTDSVPDSRIGNQAQRVLNMVPVSETNIRPRYGCEQVATYRPVINARTDIVDQLPEDINNGVLIVSTNSKYSNAGKLITEIEGVFRFRPSLTADLYQNIQGVNNSPSLYYVAYDVATSRWKLYQYDIFLGTSNAFTTALPADFSPICPYFVRTNIYGELGTDYTFSKGYIMCAGAQTPTVGSKYVKSISYNPTTGDVATDSNLNYTSVDDPAQVSSGDEYLYSAGTTLQSGLLGWFFYLKTTGGDFYPIWALNTKYATGVRTTITPASGIDIVGGSISDFSPVPFGIRTAFLMGRYGIGATDDLILLESYSDNIPADGIADPQLSTVLAKTPTEIRSGWDQDWEELFFDTCLDLQMISVRGRGAGNVVTLLGAWETPVFHKVLSSPVIAILSGPQQSVVLNRSGTGYRESTITYGLEVLNSHAPQTTYVAHGMVVNQHGDVYTVGTGDFVNGVANHLICKYNPWNLGVTQTSVSHTSNGLGDYYADPLDTHICNIMVDGAYVMVLDHDPAKTRLFVYDYDLNFVSKATLSTANASPTAATLGTSATNTAGPSTTPWIDPDNAVDTVAFATVALDQSTGDSPSDYIDVTDFGFSIPTGSTIDGITVSFNKKGSDNGGGISDIKDSTVQLIVGGSATGSNKATTTEWPVAATVTSYGGSADLWTLTPTVAQVNASNFGVRIAALAVLNEAGTASVNSVKIAIAYTPPLRVRANKYSTRFFAENY
jgi:hypothetical protein